MSGEEVVDLGRIGEEHLAFGDLAVDKAEGIAVLGVEALTGPLRGDPGAGDQVVAIGQYRSPVSAMDPSVSSRSRRRIAAKPSIPSWCYPGDVWSPATGSRRRARLATPATRPRPEDTRCQSAIHSDNIPDRRKQVRPQVAALCWSAPPAACSRDESGAAPASSGSKTGRAWWCRQEFMTSTVGKPAVARRTDWELASGHRGARRYGPYGEAPGSRWARRWLPARRCAS
jgi:hypothetical protein